jgi:hypothetical protein
MDTGGEGVMELTFQKGIDHNTNQITESSRKGYPGIRGEDLREGGAMVASGGGSVSGRWV